jgi:hypothetical protein
VRVDRYVECHGSFEYSRWKCADCPRNSTQPRTAVFVNHHDHRYSVRGGVEFYSMSSFVLCAECRRTWPVWSHKNSVTYDYFLPLLQPDPAAEHTLLVEMMLTVLYRFFQLLDLDFSEWR